jgi:predicted ArsR family transcriptional regulator
MSVLSKLITDEVIVRHLQRFGPLTTSQISRGLGVSNATLKNRLERRGSVIGISKKMVGRSLIWKYEEVGLEEKGLT